MRRKDWHQQAVIKSTLAILCMTGGWFIPAAIAPPAAHAYVARIDIALEIQTGETYDAFLRRAESVARAAVQRSFNRDVLISEVYAIIVGQRQGSSVQVLSLQVSRDQWRQRPDPRRWATYYSSAKFLLGFGGSNSPNRLVPASTQPAAPPPVIQTIPVIPAPSSVRPSPGSNPTPPTPQITPTPTASPDATEETGTTNRPAPGSTPLPPAPN